MEVMDKKMQKLLLPKTMYQAIEFGKYCDEKPITSIFAIRNKIKNRSYCRFFKICREFFLDSNICTYGGGRYCGKFRNLCLLEEKMQKRRDDK